MATEEYTNQLNKSLPEIGHIYWVPNRSWSSVLWKKLRKIGWYMTNNHGLVHVFDSSGIEICCTVGKVNALAEVSKIMR